MSIVPERRRLSQDLELKSDLGYIRPHFQQNYIKLTKIPQNNKWEM